MRDLPCSDRNDDLPKADASLEDPSHLGDLKRPLSRKKDPSASASAGLGAFSSPQPMTGAFEQNKKRQPIPVESWGPRPPSRKGLPPKATPLLEILPAGDEDHTHTPTISPSSTRSRNSGPA